MILDWTPAHFPTDEHGLMYFDGTHLYEHADPRQGMHAEWGSAIFNYGRNEVRSFLISNATLLARPLPHRRTARRRGGVDALPRLRARSGGEWIPNAVRRQREPRGDRFPARVQRVACTASTPTRRRSPRSRRRGPGVSRPTYTGGLGFGLKWDMGWMHDTLAYFSERSDRPPLPPPQAHVPQHVLLERELRAAAVTRRGRARQAVAAARRCTATCGSGSRTCACCTRTMWAQPGKKLLFQGGEIGQYDEWAHDRSVDWHLLGESPLHVQLMTLVAELNRLYETRARAARHDVGRGRASSGSTPTTTTTACSRSCARATRPRRRACWCVFNCTPVPRHDYRVGVPFGGRLARAPEHRRRGVRRQRDRQPGRRHSGRARLPRATGVAATDVAPAGRAVFEAERDEPPRCRNASSPQRGRRDTESVVPSDSPESQLEAPTPRAEGARGVVSADVGEQEPGAQVDAPGLIALPMPKPKGNSSLVRRPGGRNAGRTRGPSQNVRVAWIQSWIGTLTIVTRRVVEQDRHVEAGVDAERARRAATIGSANIMPKREPVSIGR